MLQVYTGSGKGKTTASLGLALRAMGHGLKVYMIQFMKGSQEYGEYKIRHKLPNFTLVQSGLPTFVDKKKPEPKDIALAKEGFKKACHAIKSKLYDIVILDEINVALEYKLLELSKVIQLIETAPKNIELVLTGRHAHPKIIKMADLATEMKEVKHYYKKNIEMRKGFEY